MQSPVGRLAQHCEPRSIAPFWLRHPGSCFGPRFWLQHFLPPPGPSRVIIGCFHTCWAVSPTLRVYHWVPSGTAGAINSISQSLRMLTHKKTGDWGKTGWCIQSCDGEVHGVWRSVNPLLMRLRRMFRLTDSSDCSYFLHYSVFNRAGFLPGHCGLLLLVGRFALSTLVLYGPCQMH